MLSVLRLGGLVPTTALPTLWHASKLLCQAAAVHTAASRANEAVKIPYTAPRTWSPSAAELDKLMAELRKENNVHGLNKRRQREAFAGRPCMARASKLEERLWGAKTDSLIREHFAATHPRTQTTLPTQQQAPATLAAEPAPPSTPATARQPEPVAGAAAFEQHLPEHAWWWCANGVQVCFDGHCTARVVKN